MSYAGKGGYTPLTNAQFVARMRSLNYDITAQQANLQALAGIVVAMAEEIENLRDEVMLLKGRQPFRFAA